jgi:iron complex transport system substrate-binding protein
MVQKAGGQNIVTDATNPYPQLSQEIVIAKDPEVILLGDDSAGVDTPEKILTRPGWSNITAVKNKRIVALNADLVNRPGPRAALGVENIAKALYPDLFK